MTDTHVTPTSAVFHFEHGGLIDSLAFQVRRGQTGVTITIVNRGDVATATTSTFIPSGALILLIEALKGPKVEVICNGIMARNSDLLVQTSQGSESFFGLTPEQSASLIQWLKKVRPS